MTQAMTVVSGTAQGNITSGGHLTDKPKTDSDGRDFYRNPQFTRSASDDGGLLSSPFRSDAARLESLVPRRWVSADLELVGKVSAPQFSTQHAVQPPLPPFEEFQQKCAGSGGSSEAAESIVISTDSTAAAHTGVAPAEQHAESSESKSNQTHSPRESHSFSLTTGSSRGRPVAREATCIFNGGLGKVSVFPGPIKGILRMAEKLSEYAVEGAEWPLCAQILDPVRTTVVCSGPAQILEARCQLVLYPFTICSCLEDSSAFTCCP